MRPTSSTSSLSPFSNATTVRKRIIYAHSDILIRRSDYFATMLSSSFSENASISHAERKLYTIVVEEADFETVYWLLKFCYANWLLFRQHDDPRAAVDGVGAGWSARWLTARGAEWDWKTFRKSNASEDSTVGDNRSATSLSNGEATRSSSEKSKVHLTDRQPSVSTAGARPPASPTKSNPRPTNSTQRRSVVPPAVGGMSMAMNTSTNARTKTVPVVAAPSDYSTIPHYPVSPRAGRQQHAPLLSSPDPHAHPTTAPSPASALSIYQVAHRYAMPGLANLALEHMMTTITPESAFALLLATSAWDELRSLVEVSERFSWFSSAKLV